MMLYSWISFWLTYLVLGCYFYNDDMIQLMPNQIVTTKNLLNTIGLNAILTFLFIPFANMIPTLIYYPHDLYGYILRILTALMIGDLCFYWSHRLFHHRLFYKFHKKHHFFIIPTALAGVFCSPVEMMISNHLSMVLALKLVDIYSTEMLIIESAAVAANILLSHSHKTKYLNGSPHHDLHHLKLNCNYGFSYITDIVFGTYQI